MAWEYQGKDSHNTPFIIRFGRFGPSEGAVWSCQCGKSHTLLKLETGALEWDWKVKEALAEAKEQSLRLPPIGFAGNPIGARLIPHDRRQFIAGLADACHADEGNAERDDHWMINRAVAKLESWGYIQFPAPVAGATVEDGTS